MKKAVENSSEREFLNHLIVSPAREPYGFSIPGVHRIACSTQRVPRARVCPLDALRLTQTRAPAPTRGHERRINRESATVSSTSRYRGAIIISRAERTARACSSFPRACNQYPRGLSVVSQADPRGSHVGSSNKRGRFRKIVRVSLKRCTTGTATCSSVHCSRINVNRALELFRGLGG